MEENTELVPLVGVVKLLDPAPPEPTVIVYSVPAVTDKPVPVL
jgi:hypothetical protein